MNRIFIRTSLIGVLLILHGLSHAQISGDFSKTVLTLSAPQLPSIPTLSEEQIEKSRSLSQIATSRTLLCKYDEDLDPYTSYSPKWAARVLFENRRNGHNWCIELNGEKKWYPYVAPSTPFDHSGKHVVYTTLEKVEGAEGHRWGIYLDGEGVGLYEPDQIYVDIWTGRKGLKGLTSFIQFQCPRLTFLPSGANIVFKIDEKVGQRLVQGTSLGKAYSEMSPVVGFLSEQPVYRARLGDQCFLVVGKTEHGPYKWIGDVAISKNRKHFAAAIKTETGQIILVDGKEFASVGDLEKLAIADNGQYGFIYHDGKNFKVANGEEVWPGVFLDSRFSSFQISLNGENIGGWFKESDGWYVVLNGTRKYGPYKSPFSISTDESYSLFVGQSGTVCYFALSDENDAEWFVNGKQSDVHVPDFGGIVTTTIVDGKTVVGIERVGAIEGLDIPAVADATSAGSSDPLRAKYRGKDLVYKASDSQASWIWAGSANFGPFGRCGEICVSQDGLHYAFLAENTNGKWLVIDGRWQTPYYSDIHLPFFISETEVSFLTLENGNVMSISARIPPEERR